MCGPVWVSPCSSLGLSFPLGNEGEHCVRKALGLLGTTLGILRQKRTAGQTAGSDLDPAPFLLEPEEIRFFLLFYLLPWLWGLEPSDEPLCAQMAHPGDRKSDSVCRGPNLEA